MTRMGHDSMRAALIYRHRTQGADRRIADAMENLIGEHEKAPDTDSSDSPDGAEGGAGEDPDDGAAGALVRSG